MRGFVVGLLMLMFVVLSVLSLRPGGMRNQLKNVARRFKVALVLAGAYVVASAVLKLAVQDQTASTLGTLGVGLILGLVFIYFAQERQQPS